MAILSQGLCRDNAAEHCAYNNAKQRCTNPKNCKFPSYGARGIEFRFACFKDFFALLGKRPSAEHQLDRIDTDGHYEAGNVRWATRKENNRNRRNNRVLTYKGQTKSLAEWSEQTGIAWSTLRCRLDSGWAAEQAVEAPIDLISRENGRSTCR